MEYVSNYYDIRSIVKDLNIPIPLRLEATYNLVKIFPLLDVIKNADEYTDDVLLTEDLAKGLTDMLVKYKALSIQKDWKNPIDNLINDIEKYKGNTVAQVLRDFKMAR